uniref:Uncharacterized protein n=1 Tax=Culex tarsalis TaxID=7177 RepID=A0A1Q3FNN8_CULTA
MRTLGILLTIAIHGRFLVQGYPGKLAEQRYEFQQQQRSVPAEFEEFSSDVTTPEYEDHEPVAFVPSPKWSQLHPNEVNAFAEVYRQSYNQLVDQYNRLFGLQYGYVMPVQYQLFELPTGISWRDYFGSQQQYVSQQTDEMSRRLFYQIQNGTIAQHDLQAPSFFVNQAADLLDQVHGHVQEAVPPQEYQQHEIMPEETDTQPQFNERDHEKVLALNPATGTYEYVYVQKKHNQEKPSARENVRTSYIQSLPPVQFDNGAFRRDVEDSEEFPERTTNPSTVQTTTDDYYGSTYEQQQKYDLQFLESISSSSTSKPNNVISLVRRKQGPTSTSTTTTTTTTTPNPTTESNVMSMLPHKQQTVDYINLHQQIRQALDQHMKQQNSTNSTAVHEESHFMGMTSNQDHLKLTYDVVDNQQSKPTQGTIRGDQESSNEIFVTDEPIELETTESTPRVVTQKVTMKPNSPKPKPTQIPNIKPAASRTIPLYSAPLAPFPAVIHESNQFYAAPLAPFPGLVHVEPAQVQTVQFAELEDMNQQHFHPEQHAIFPAYEDQHQEVQVLEQIPAEFVVPAYGQHPVMTHVLGLQQQSQIGPELFPQFLEKQLPPEQAYRNPELGAPQAVVPIKRNEEPVQIQEVTTDVPLVHEPKPWLQRQWTKLVKHF